jgi:hypothetical protein
MAAYASSKTYIGHSSEAADLRRYELQYAHYPFHGRLGSCNRALFGGFNWRVLFNKDVLGCPRVCLAVVVDLPDLVGAVQVEKRDL